MRFSAKLYHRTCNYFFPNTFAQPNKNCQGKKTQKYNQAEKKTPTHSALNIV